ncbi:MAG: hypothetical protein DMF61_07305 [Blastocatellia bacterium AA13]|nr:MAG: hypothetical protein DMF61_07305 [Blastocatellia bacterium AA13]
MIKRMDQLPAVLCCFAYREQYFAEMEGMLATAREHHPTWPLIVGRGPAPGFDLPTFEVESPSGKLHWTLPVQLNADGTEDDFFKIIMMKGWWMAQVWRNFGHLVESSHMRLVWSDADNRFNGPLDVELDPLSEVVAGPWWYDRENRGFDTICSGLLMFQGAKNGVVSKLLSEWSAKCLDCIQNLPPQTKPWRDSDQEVLTAVLAAHPQADSGYELFKLDMTKYSGCPVKDGRLVRRALIDSWYMIERMRLPEYHDVDWPPPEDYRRYAPIGTPLPGWNPDEEASTE